MEAFASYLTLATALLNTGMLTAIWCKIGGFTEKHKSHERRLELLEQGIIHHAKAS